MVGLHAADRGGSPRGRADREASRLHASGCTGSSRTARISGNTSPTCARCTTGRAASGSSPSRRGSVSSASCVKLLDESEFLSPHGIRSLSRVHKDMPYRLDGERQRVARGLRAGRGHERPLRRQLELARARLVPGQLPAHRSARALSPLLRRRAAGRMPDGLRQAASISARSRTS